MALSPIVCLPVRGEKVLYRSPTWGTIQSEKAISNAGARLIDAEKQCALELWKYDPRLICGDGKADVLSLAISLKDVADERVEQMLDEILTEVW
ncbi:MAG: hypothetical protein PHP26_06240 [Syntrophomonas sp.]|uniref:hypothetical protein n=1 Tax=Syntrophomonas sp. TaxID=2053627 RepID=UPI0026181B6B|nr:hypothetical protein [Syntrophomonas sp.]MDD2510474.1 hypothetical protein [Syntrophomonas sp.]MDD3879572.1 hypothetical protein [Syntrophomonas sp.]MDD4627015.1 hypothetical protein [Syntrophomonas sp.]